MKHPFRFLAAAALAAGLFSCSGNKTLPADYGVVPLPQEIKLTGEAPYLLKTNSVTIGYGDAILEKEARLLAGYLEEITGRTPAVKAGAGDITLSLDSLSAELVSQPESYRLSVSQENGIRISGATPASVFYGIQTLRKSLPADSRKANVELAAADIYDFPRFPYRGMHLDVSRHFSPADSVKVYIDMLALHNMNKFHWHLTDDQGWRIEIKRYPELTEKGSVRKETVIGRNSGEYDGTPYGPYFYTQDEIRDIIAYAAERHITIIPEVDLPGHMLAALHTYPELGCTGGPYEVWGQWGVAEDVLCAGNEDIYEFLENVLSEVIDLFPSEYIHIGGDESPKVRWQTCPKCQAKIKELGIKGDKHHTAEEYLQSYVITRMEQFVESKGRHIIGWDEILEGGLAPNATVMSWTGVQGGIEAAKQGHDVIMTPTVYCYFDYYQSADTENEPFGIGGYVPMEKVYSFEPTLGIPEDKQHHVIGVQANLWREYIKTFGHVQYMVMPRMAALAEVQWMMPEQRDYQSFLPRVARLTKLYDVLGYNYAKHLFDVNVDITSDPQTNTLVATMSKLTDDGEIYYTLDGSEPTAASLRYESPVAIDSNTELKAVLIRNGVPSRVFGEKLSFNKATTRPVTLADRPNPTYAFAGAQTLTDGRTGDGNYKTGRWIGFSGRNLDATIDLQQPAEISRVFFQTNVEKGDWIMSASGATIRVSDDGENFREVASEKYPSLGQNDRNGVYSYELTFAPVEARYVQVLILGDRLPAWHGGAGRPAYLFVDEIGIE